MMMPVRNILSSFSKGLLDFFFPENCSACGNLLLDQEDGICIPCLASLPLTDFHLLTENPVFQQIKGRIPVSAASAGFYFRKGNSIQKIMHEIKYKKDWKSARVLGRYYGPLLFANPEFRDIDGLIPVPIHSKRREQRGFNQSEEFAIGLSEIIDKPVWTQSLIRKGNSGSQSWKRRENRFDIIGKDFKIRRGENLQNQKVLLVDDIITTGATLEACGQLIYSSSKTPIKIVSIAYTSL